MRPILPWLMILDEKTLDRVVRTAPEITFEGGDPTHLPAETRGIVLRQVCEQLAQAAHGRSALDYAAVQRFAGADIAGDVRSLLTEYAEDDNILWFLLRLVWHGELKEAAPQAKRCAIECREKYARMAALKAVRTVGTEQEQGEVLDTILSEPGVLLREWLDEIMQGLPRDEVAVSWLSKALAKVEARERFTVDNLSTTLITYLDGLPSGSVAKLTTDLGELIKQPPLVERRHCRISHCYQWLAQAVSHAIARLIEVRHSTALEARTLSTLRVLRASRDHHDTDMEKLRADLPQLIPLLADSEQGLFWHCVTETRAERAEAEGPLIDYWDVSIFGSDWEFGSADFDRVIEDVTTRSLPDDRRVALSLAFSIYHRSGRPRAWRERMKRATNGNAELLADLKQRLRPPAAGRARWREQERRWKLRRAATSG